MMKVTLERRNKSWFALADTKQCRLLRWRLTAGETPHVDQYDLGSANFDHLLSGNSDHM